MKTKRGEGPTSLLGTDGLLLTVIFVGILGCTPITPLSQSIPRKSQDPAGLSSILAQRADRFRSIRSLARVYYWDREEQGVFQEAILIHRPNRLRLETLSNFGAILIVTADEDEVVGYHLREGIFYRGRSSKENLLRYTQIPLELGELTALLLGLPPVGIYGRWKREGNSLYREDSTGRTEVVVFHPTLKIPTEWERSGPEGEVELTALFSDFFSTPAGLFPLKISLEVYALERRLEIRYEGPEVNVTLPASYFALKKPDHVKELPLESLGG